MKTTPHFLNVDVDLQASAPLERLAAEFGDAIYVLQREPSRGEWFLSFEVSGCRPESADAVLGRLCGLVERLPAAARATWNACKQRDFNLGFDSGAVGARGAAHESRISVDTLKRVAALGGTLTVTVYPVYESCAPVAGAIPSAQARNRRRRHRMATRRR